MTKKKYPEGHFIGLGIAIGLPLGIPLAVSTGNYGLMGAGIAIGVAIGVAMEKEHKERGEIRALTKEEKRRKEKLTKIAIISLLIGLGVFAGLFFYMLFR